MQRTWWTSPGYSLSRHALVIWTRLLLTSEGGRRTQTVISTVEPRTIALSTLLLCTAYDQWDQTSNWSYDSSRRSMSSLYSVCILQHQFYWKNILHFQLPVMAQATSVAIELMGHSFIPETPTKEALQIEVIYGVQHHTTHRTSHGRRCLPCLTQFTTLFHFTTVVSWQTIATNTCLSDPRDPVQSTGRPNKVCVNVVTLLFIRSHSLLF